MACAAADADVFSPLDVELRLSRAPLVGEEAKLELTLESRERLGDVSLAVSLPEGAELVEGDLLWRGDVAASQRIVFPLKFRVTAPGNKSIRATAFTRVDDHTSYGDVADLFFHSDSDFALMGHVLDFVPTQTSAVSAATGEVVSPMGLAEYYSRPMAQEPVGEPEPCAAVPGMAAPQDSEPAPDGTLAVTGEWRYYDRADADRPLQWVLVQLLRGNNDSLLASTYTDENGRFTFAPVNNPGANGFKVRVKTYYYSSYSCDGAPLRIRSSDASDEYSALTSVTTSADGTCNIGVWHIANGSTNEGAWWLMQDLVKGFWWPASFGGYQKMPGGVTVVWSPTSTTGNYNVRGGNIYLKAANSEYCDTLLHEYGHEVQYDGYGGWLPASDCPNPHYIQRNGGVNCAWYEGFATWYKMVVTGEPFYRWPGGASVNLEAPSWGTSGWDNGDLCEGRVTGALWDLGDSSADGYDTAQIPWSELWDVWYGSANRDSTFAQFWARWKSRGKPTHHAVKALYQNTIDYNTWPTFAGLPSITTPEDTPALNAVRVWDYASDPESSHSELVFQITANSNPSCGLSLDPAGYISLNPLPNWFGSSDITVGCTDGIRTRTASFTIIVSPVNDIPVISGLPGRMVTKGRTWYQAIDLWAHASDIETIDSALSFTVTGNTDPGCGVLIESGRWIGINPAVAWTGTSLVTIRVTDADGDWAEDAFRIVVGERCATAADARAYPDGAWVVLDPQTVAARFAGAFYMTDSRNRLGGIRVSFADPPDEGRTTGVAGRMSTHEGERQVDCYMLSVE